MSTNPQNVSTAIPVPEHTSDHRRPVRANGSRTKAGLSAVPRPVRPEAVPERRAEAPRLSLKSWARIVTQNSTDLQAAEWRKSAILRSRPCHGIGYHKGQNRASAVSSSAE